MRKSLRRNVDLRGVTRSAVFSSTPIQLEQTRVRLERAPRGDRHQRRADHYRSYPLPHVGLMLFFGALRYFQWNRFVLGGSIQTEGLSHSRRGQRPRSSGQ